MIKMDEEISPPVCTNCKFRRRDGLFNMRGDLCTHPACVDEGFTHRDIVTGKETVHPSRPDTCWSSRVGGACGVNGIYWQAKG